MSEESEIGVQEARKALQEGDRLFVDIRDPDSFGQEHIPGAIHLHDGNLEEFVRTTDKSRAVIIYCYHGNNSMGGAAYLRDQGFKTVRSLQGGFEKWREQNSPDQPGSSSP